MLTKPGNLWMKVIVGLDLANTSSARVVCVVPFADALSAVKPLRTSRSSRSMAVSLPPPNIEITRGEGDAFRRSRS